MNILALNDCSPALRGAGRRARVAQLIPAGKLPIPGCSLRVLGMKGYMNPQNQPHEGLNAQSLDPEKIVQRVKADFQVLALRDVRAGHYLTPFFAKNLPSAIRSLTDETQKAEKSMLFRFPGDYQLYRLGEFFEDTGHLDALVNPELICEVQDLKDLKKETQLT